MIKLTKIGKHYCFKGAIGYFEVVRGLDGLGRRAWIMWTFNQTGHLYRHEEFRTLKAAREYLDKWETKYREVIGG